MNLLHDKQLFNKVPYQSTKYRKKEVCVDNIKSIGDGYCPTCRNEKCVYISTNKRLVSTTVKIAKTAATFFIFLLRTKNRHFFCLVVTVHIVYTSRDYGKPSPFLKKFLRQSQASTSEPQPKKVKMTRNVE